jgi:hypothetical protein
MLRKTLCSLAAAAAVVGAVALTPTDASARPRGHGFHGFRHGHAFHHFRRPHLRVWAGPYAYYNGGCWRWLPTVYGPQLVNVCRPKYYDW